MREILGRCWALPAVALLFSPAIGCSEPFDTSGAGGTSGSGASTTSHGGAGGRSAQGGGGLGGSTTGSEQCSNGMDDDDDQLVDCLDPDCSGAGYVCMSIPGGWTGPVTLVPGDGAACPAPWIDAAVTGGTGVTADPLSCDCACDLPDNVSCGTSTTLHMYLDAGCQTPSGFSSGATTVCSILQNPAATMRIPAPGISGTCGVGTPSTTATPPVQVLGRQALCNAPSVGTGCDGSGVCAPPTGAGALCFYKLGTNACPVGFAQTILYGGSDDQRSCACGCTFEGSCVATLTGYGTSGCGGNTTVHPADNSCRVVGVNSGSVKLTSLNGTGSCQPNASAQGTVTPTGAMTVCCLP